MLHTGFRCCMQRLVASSLPLPLFNCDWEGVSGVRKGCCEKLTVQVEKDSHR